MEIIFLPWSHFTDLEWICLDFGQRQHAPDNLIYMLCKLEACKNACKSSCDKVRLRWQFSCMLTNK